MHQLYFFKYLNNQYPNYLNEIFQTAPENNIQTRGSFLKLKYPFRKTNTGQMALSYIGRSIWSKTPDTLKQTKNLNMFKHSLREHYLKELKNSKFSLALYLENKSLQFFPFLVFL